VKALREAKSATLLKQEAEEFLGIGRRALRELERAGLSRWCHAAGRHLRLQRRHQALDDQRGPGLHLDAGHCTSPPMLRSSRLLPVCVEEDRPEGPSGRDVQGLPTQPSP